MSTCTECHVLFYKSNTYTVIFVHYVNIPFHKLKHEHFHDILILLERIFQTQLTTFVFCLVPILIISFNIFVQRQQIRIEKQRKVRLFAL